MSWLRHIELQPSALLPFAFLNLCFAMRLGWKPSLSVSALIMISLLLHECGHVVVAAVCGVKVKRIGLSILGGYTVREHSGRPSVEALSAVTGPLVNLIIFAALRPIGGEAAHTLATANLVLGLSNLLPLPGSDGWRLWKAISTRTGASVVPGGARVVEAAGKAIPSKFV